MICKTLQETIIEANKKGVSIRGFILTKKDFEIALSEDFHKAVGFEDGFFLYGPDRLVAVRPGKTIE